MTSLFEDHLGLDAIVAFADGEMGMLAYQRAAAHIARCSHCAAEVSEQTMARDLLRSAAAPRMPGSLFDQLRSIPVALPGAPGGVVAPPGGAVGPAAEPGQHQHDAGRRRRFRLGAGFLIAGITVSALTAVAAGRVDAPSPVPGSPDTAQVTGVTGVPTPSVQEVLVRVGR